MRFRLAIIVALILTFLPAKSEAFRTKTHLWVAEEVLLDIADGCQLRSDAQHCVTIEICVHRDDDDPDLVYPWTSDAECYEREYPLEQQVAQSLLTHGPAYRAGHIGPDAFPDLLVGQSAAHPGLDGRWQADDWLEWLLRHADDDESRAFALGWAGHMAGDVFGHTWVNAYSGDKFVLSDGEQTVERRHFAIEAFAGRFTPDIGHQGKTLLRPPYRFLARRLILDEAIAEQLTDPSAGGPHLLAMYAVHRALSEALKPLSTPPAFEIFDQAHDLRHRIHRAGLEIRRLGDPKRATQRHIEAAKKVLAAHDEKIALQQQAVEAAKKAVGDLLRAKNEAEDLLRSGPQRLEDLGDSVARLKSERDKLDQWVDRTFVEKACKSLPGIGGLLCNSVTKVKRELSGAWKRLDDEVGKIRDQASNLRSAIEQARTDLIDLPRRQAEAETARALADAELARLRVARAADRNGQEALTRASETLRELELQEAALLARIEELEAELDPLGGPGAGLRALRKFLEEWRNDVETAVEAYIEAGEISSRAFIDDEDPLEPYIEWLKCWSPALTGVPSQLSRAGCAILRTVDDFLQQVEDLRREFHEEVGETGGWILDPAYKAKQEVLKLLKPALENAVLDLAQWIGGEETRTLVEMIRFDPTDENIDDLFATDQSGKKLLLIPDAARRMKLDMAVVEGRISPRDFDAFRNAVVLTKLTLLSPKELNHLAEEFGVWPSTLFGDQLFPNTPRFNILTDAIRSLDGDHQWNTHAPPYLRRPGYRDTSSRADRTYGYRPPKGFRPWQSRKARRLMFRGLFRGPLTPGLLDLIPAGHPHRPSEAQPFPDIP